MYYTVVIKYSGIQNALTCDLNCLFDGILQCWAEFIMFFIGVELQYSYTHLTCISIVVGRWNAHKTNTRQKIIKAPNEDIHVYQNRDSSGWLFE